MDAAARVIRPGVTTDEIDRVVHEATIAAGMLILVLFFITSVACFITRLVHDSSDSGYIGVTSCFSYDLLKLVYLFIVTYCRRISISFKLSFLPKVMLHVGCPFVYLLYKFALEHNILIRQI